MIFQIRKNMEVPKHLGHKPIIGVKDYDKKDGIHANDTDAQALSIGRSQYDQYKISGKVFRHNGSRWNFRSEEMPIHRIVDLAILVIATIKRGQSSQPDLENSLSSLDEKVIDYSQLDFLLDSIKNDKELNKKILELKKNINAI